MPRSSSRQPRRPALDLDEIAPNRFIVHNPHAVPLLKGEGTIAGRLFELTTWRREGLLARLRERGFGIRTIADRIGALPAPPRPHPIGEPLWRPLTSAIEHFSHFDIERLAWQPLAPQAHGEAAGVSLRDGWVLRRRKGRGPSAFYMAARERGGGAGLKALDETSAVLAGYALALAHDPRPWLVERRGADMLLPDVELPPPHRAALALFGRESEGSWLVDQERGWPLGRELFARLGVRLVVEEERSPT
jgi:hypothetical protein